MCAGSAALEDRVLCMYVHRQRSAGRQGALYVCVQAVRRWKTGCSVCAQAARRWKAGCSLCMCDGSAALEDRVLCMCTGSALALEGRVLSMYVCKQCSAGRQGALYVSAQAAQRWKAGCSLCT